MKKVLVVCGAGIATSTVVLEKLKTFLEENQLTSKVHLIQASAVEVNNLIDEIDFIVTTTQLSDSITKPIIKAMSLLTGINTQKFYDQFLLNLNSD